MSFPSCRVWLLSLASSLPVDNGEMEGAVQNQPQPLISLTDSERISVGLPFPSRVTSYLSQETEADHGYSVLGVVF